MEKIIFKTFSDLGKEEKLCIHIHYPMKSNGRAFLFLNPLFDEKKRSQKFQAITARKMQNIGYTVVRFDYYGTGDSSGDFSELTIQSCINNCNHILSFIRNEIKIGDISILGIRFGGSLSLKLALDNEGVTFFLVEPIISGKRYLTELRLRRKAFFMLNNMKNKSDKIIIDNNEFEDHQGYLISKELVEELSSFDLFKISLSHKKVLLMSLDVLHYKKLSKFNEILSKNNDVNFIRNGTPTFWNTMEIIDVKLLTNIILKHV